MQGKIFLGTALFDRLLLVSEQQFNCADSAPTLLYNLAKCFLSVFKCQRCPALFNSFHIRNQLKAWKFPNIIQTDSPNLLRESDHEEQRITISNHCHLSHFKSTDWACALNILNAGDRSRFNNTNGNRIPGHTTTCEHKRR